MKGDTESFVNITREIASTFGRRMQFDLATPKQVNRIRTAMEECLSQGLSHERDRQVRIAVLAHIFPFGPQQKVLSTKDLSKAEASALIQQLYGLEAGDTLNEDCEVCEEAYNALCDIASSLEGTRDHEPGAHQVEGFFDPRTGAILPAMPAGPGDRPARGAD